MMTRMSFPPQQPRYMPVEAELGQWYKEYYEVQERTYKEGMITLPADPWEDRLVLLLTAYQWSEAQRQALQEKLDKVERQVKAAKAALDRLIL